MAKTSKDYKRIINHLDNLKGHTKDMARDGEDIWKQDTQAIDEAMDIISDYEKCVEQTNAMIKQYETPEMARKSGAGVYVCPQCGKRTQVGHSHCHWCGKRLSWDRQSYAERDYPHLQRGGKR